MRVGQLGYCFMQGPSTAMVATLTSPHNPASTASEDSKIGSVSPKTGCIRVHAGRDLTKNGVLQRKKGHQIFTFTSVAKIITDTNFPKNEKAYWSNAVLSIAMACPTMEYVVLTLQEKHANVKKINKFLCM